MKLCNPRDPGAALFDPEGADLISPLAPVNVPQVLPSGYPHNLPPLRDQVRYSPFTGLDAGSAPSGTPTPTPGVESFFDPHHYASLIQGVQAVGTTSIQLLTEPATRRNMLAIRNSSPGTEIVYVSFGSAATASSWLRLTANQIVLFDEVVPQDDVYVISDTATGQVSYAFSTIP